MSADPVDRLFDGLSKLSELVQKNDRVRRLRADLAAVGTTCGDCALWMKRACPKEVNVNGRNKGPSCAAPRCSAYSEAPSVEKRRETLRQSLQEEMG